MEKEENNSSETDEGPKMPNKEFQENLWLMKIKWMVDIYNKKKAQMKKEGVVYN